jgi:hypothetical protein
VHYFMLPLKHLPQRTGCAVPLSKPTASTRCYSCCCFGRPALLHKTTDSVFILCMYKHQKKKYFSLIFIPSLSNYFFLASLLILRISCTITFKSYIHKSHNERNMNHIKDVPEGKDLTSEECSLGQTTPI